MKKYKPCFVTEDAEALWPLKPPSSSCKMCKHLSSDIPDTYADVTDLVEKIHYQPATTVEEGIKLFVEWYRNYFKV